MTNETKEKRNEMAIQYSKKNKQLSTRKNYADGFDAGYELAKEKYSQSLPVKEAT